MTSVRHMANCGCCGRLADLDANGRIEGHPAEPQLGANDITDRRPCRGAGHKPEGGWSR